MQILEVDRQDKALVKRFLELPKTIYANDPNWIRPLDKDIEMVFDPGRNKFWKHGRAIRWILENDKGETIGRVAAFINERTAHTENQPTGGMGFFECINDREAAFKLFDTCKEWLEEQGMEAMDGPINFGERTSWWGLLVDGFYEPIYQMNYNAPYYVQLWEDYGWQLYFKQFVMYRSIQEDLPPDFVAKGNNVLNNPDYSFKALKKKDLDQFTEEFLTVYNIAWGGHDNFKLLKREQAYKIMGNLKPLLAEELVWFAYYKGEPICIFIMIPDLNQIFKSYDGKWGLVQKAKTWWRLKFPKSDKCYGIIFGIVPEHHGVGIPQAISIKAKGLLKNHIWDHMEMVWIGDFNPGMIRLAESSNARKYKTYHTMRYLFDREAPYERHPMIQETEESKANRQKQRDEVAGEEE